MATATAVKPAEKITLAWEVLPDTRGKLHAVDPNPEIFVEAYPTSLCRTMLIVKDAVVIGSDVCEDCLEISRQRQAAFDIERGQ